MAEADEPQLVPTDAELTLAGGDAVFDSFLELTVWDVEAAAERSRKRSSAGTTWVGLYNVMMRRGFLRVEELGAPAARSWAAHLGVVGDPASAAEEPAAGSPPDL
jgi:hypothetical protein